MSVPTFRLVFQGKIAPEQNIAEVKSRLQKLFKKDAATIDKMFSGKKVALKQGLSEAQAQQYQEKMQSLGVLCEIESQSPPPAKEREVARAPAPSSTIARPASSSTSQTTVNHGPISENLPPLKLADIDKAFSGTIPKVELPNSYKAGIVAVGITMVLLPIIYIGIVAMLGYGVLNHSISNVSWIESLGYKFGFIAYITPIIVGLTVMLFMIKPLFARPVAAATSIKLDPLKEPIFFHFVNKIALAVGAPRPKQIEVNCEVNASASFRKGLFSFIGDDLVLTIGMPLLAGFNARQLAGVLAHEFGHFSQGVGMRFHYLTYKVNSWFFNAVYLRDSWDEKLEATAEETDGWLSVILNFARGGVWATRKVLYGFMMAGHAVSSYMLRQMEFDADRYEAHMAGSEQFKDTTLQLQRLGVAFQVSHDQLAQAWEDKKLVDNLPRLIAHNSSQLPVELDRTLLNQMQEAKTQVYDSHPSDNERIDSAMVQQAKGIFSLARNSQDLFKSFDAIAKQVSNSYYAHQLGLEFDKNKLVDVNQVVQITRENEKQQEAYHQYFRDMAPVFELPISVNIFDTSKVDWDELLEQYQAVNEQIAEQIGQRRKLMAQANESYDKYQKLLAIDIFRDCGFVMFPEWFGMDEQTFAKYREMIPKQEQSWQQVMGQLQPMFSLNDQRLSIALTLLNHPVLMERNADHAQHLKARNRLSLLINNFKRNAEHVTDFQFAYFKLDALLACAPLMGQKPEAMSTVMNGLLENVRQSYDQLTAALGRLDYPFVAEGEHLTIADYIADFLPHKNHCANVLQYYMQCGELTLEKLESIYARIISGLANIALTMDRLIPGMNEPYHVSESAQEQPQVQPQVQQQVVNGSFVDSSSNFNDQQTEETSVAPAMLSLEPEKPAVIATAKDSAARATFAIDESGQDSVNQSQDKEQEPPATEATAEDAEDKARIATSSAVKLELSDTAVATSGAAAENTLTLEAAPVQESANKAVFSIDEAVDKPDAPEVKEAPAPYTEPAKKAVFSIDDPMDKEEEEEEPNRKQPLAESGIKAVFAIDETEDKPEITGVQKAAADKEATLSSDMLNVGVTAGAKAPAATSVVETGEMVTQPDEQQSEQAGLSLEPPAPTSDAANSENVSAENITETNQQDTTGLALSLEPVDGEPTAEQAPSKKAATQTSGQFSETDDAGIALQTETTQPARLSLEPSAEALGQGELNSNASPSSLSLESIEDPAASVETAADTQEKSSDLIEKDSVSQSGQDALVTESKAAVLTLEPMAKSGEIARLEDGAGSQGHEVKASTTETVNKTQSNAGSSGAQIDIENKDSTVTGPGLSVQSK